MSEDSLTRKPPPAAAMKEQLDSITDNIETLIERQAKTGDIARLLEEARDIMQESVDLSAEQSRQLLDRLGLVLQRLTPPPRPWYQRFDGFVLTVCGLLALGLGVLLGMRLASVPRYDQLALGVHAVLVQSYPTLPKAVQEQLSAVYKEQHITGPGQAQGKGKP